MSDLENLRVSDNTKTGRTEGPSFNTGTLGNSGFNNDWKQAHAEGKSESSTSLPNLSINFNEPESSDTQSNGSASVKDFTPSNSDLPQGVNKPSNEVAPRRYEDPNPNMRGEFPLSTCLRDPRFAPNLADPDVWPETRAREERIAAFCAPLNAALERERQQRQQQQRPQHRPLQRAEQRLGR